MPFNFASTTLSHNYTLEIRWDYLLHALAYAPLSVMLGLFLKKRSLVQKQQEINKIRFWILVIVLSMLITALFELVQLIIPYRNFNINDILANGVGTVLGLMVILIFGRFLERIFKIPTGYA